MLETRFCPFFPFQIGRVAMLRWSDTDKLQHWRSCTECVRDCWTSEWRLGHSKMGVASSGSTSECRFLMYGISSFLNYCFRRETSVVLLCRCVKMHVLSMQSTRVVSSSPLCCAAVAVTWNALSWWGQRCSACVWAAEGSATGTSGQREESCPGICHLPVSALSTLSYTCVCHLLKRSAP